MRKSCRLKFPLTELFAECLGIKTKLLNGFWIPRLSKSQQFGPSRKVIFSTGTTKCGRCPKYTLRVCGSLNI
uniref:Uncharacterized protein n=1 Tax=uncultured marine virus TaxID=186617 RepID=A0A0F7L967_9VIRU|nr:hypothetical protein [uncultured marine virus]